MVEVKSPGIRRVIYISAGYHDYSRWGRYDQAGHGNVVIGVLATLKDTPLRRKRLLPIVSASYINKYTSFHQVIVAPLIGTRYHNSMQIDSDSGVILNIDHS